MKGEQDKIILALKKKHAEYTKLWARKGWEESKGKLVLARLLHHHWWWTHCWWDGLEETGFAWASWYCSTPLLLLLCWQCIITFLALPFLLFFRWQCIIFVPLAQVLSYEASWYLCLTLVPLPSLLFHWLLSSFWHQFCDGAPHSWTSTSRNSSHSGEPPAGGGCHQWYEYQKGFWIHRRSSPQASCGIDLWPLHCSWCSSLELA